MSVRNGMKTALGLALVTIAAPALAKDETVAVATCERPVGSVAIIEGDQQGWTQFGLGSPRELIAKMIQQSGCFTLHNAASGRSADYLVSAVAGSKEEIDQSMNLAKGALTEGLIRSGAAGQILGKVPLGGALFRAFGGLGGKKKTVIAGLRLVSPATGQTLISGTGESKKSFVKLLGAGDWAGSGDAALGGYTGSADGKMLTGAFIQAFNGLVTQRTALAATNPVAVAQPAPAR